MKYTINHISSGEDELILNYVEENEEVTRVLAFLRQEGKKLLGWKYAALLALIVVFNVICIGFDIIGLVCIGGEMPMKEYVLYHGMSLLMQVEIGSVCFLISAFCKRKQPGLALGLAVLLYMMEVMAHIVPDLEILKYVTPYYYANTADIFSGSELQWGLAILGLVISVLAVGAGGMVYGKRDIAA